MTIRRKAASPAATETHHSIKDDATGHGSGRERMVFNHFPSRFVAQTQDVAAANFIQVGEEAVVGAVVAVAKVEFAGLEQTAHGGALANFPLADLDATGLEVDEAQLDVKAHGLLPAMLVAPGGPFHAGDNFPNGAIEDVDEVGGNASDFFQAGWLAGEAFGEEAPHDGLENVGREDVLGLGKPGDGNRPIWSHRNGVCQQ